MNSTRKGTKKATKGILRKVTSEAATTSVCGTAKTFYRSGKNA